MERKLDREPLEAQVGKGIMGAISQIISDDTDFLSLILSLSYPRKSNHSACIRVLTLMAVTFCNTAQRSVTI